MNKKKPILMITTKRSASEIIDNLAITKSTFVLSFQNG
jgi:hypothetical protein